MMTNTNTGRNVSLTIDGDTYIVTSAKLEAAKKWARIAKDQGSTVSLKWTDEKTEAQKKAHASAETRRRWELEDALHTLRRIGHEDDDGQALEDAIESGLIPSGDYREIERAINRIVSELAS